ncbi:hypothetical protein COMA1_90007 [Candidatus Nitrospira nitrosa]|uniref:Uncharacterized protein n=1 Tax=Candidatus Nitrospira nitrosa TaxID=1742972 RepID=A0A0S4LXF5_9BACT|nr:hypothetical protein COMA1_90007 [Candidatus Nitrospira nitrosa]
MDEESGVRKVYPKEGLIYSEFRSRASQISGVLKVHWPKN